MFFRVFAKFYIRQIRKVVGFISACRSLCSGLFIFLHCLPTAKCFGSHLPSAFPRVRTPDHREFRLHLTNDNESFFGVTVHCQVPIISESLR